MLVRPRRGKRGYGIILSSRPDQHLPYQSQAARFFPHQFVDICLSKARRVYSKLVSRFAVVIPIGTDDLS